VCPAIALPRHRMWQSGVRRSSDMTRGRAGGREAIRVAVICVSPVCLSVGRYHFINYRGGRSGGGGGGVSCRRRGSVVRFIVCQCIAGGAVRRATSAVMRLCRGGAVAAPAACPTPRSAVERRDRGRFTCQPASMTCRICVRVLQRCGKERNFDMHTKECNTKYTTLIYIYSYRRRNTCTKCVCAVWCARRVRDLHLCPAHLWPDSAAATVGGVCVGLFSRASAVT